MNGPAVGPESLSIELAASPAVFASGRLLATQPQVTMIDSTGATVTSDTASVTVAIESGSGQLSGTTTVPAVGGVAKFTDLKITGTGAFTLRFTTVTPALQVTSPVFAVFAVIAETSMSALPWTAIDTGNVIFGGATPSSLESIVSGAGLPVNIPGGKALKHIIEAGTPPGAYGPGSDGGGFSIGSNLTASGANGGPAGNEYSSLYQSFYFCLYGDGTTFEYPDAGGFKFGLWAVTNNNMNSSGGISQLFGGPVAVANLGGAPKTASDFYWYNYSQNGTNQTFAQNMNTDKHIVVGKVHHYEQVMTLGTNGGGNGTWDWWIDGVQVGHYTNAKFIDAAYANAGGKGGDGLAGFWAWDFRPVWGGGGASNKTRDDIIYLGPVLVSGIFLRARQ